MNEKIVCPCGEVLVEKYYFIRINVGVVEECCKSCKEPTSAHRV